MKLFTVLVLIACASWVSAAAPKLRLGHSRVINGVNAKPNQFPHQISMQMNGGHFCGGSIISEKWIVTAAHCILGSSISVKAGITDLRDYGGQTIRVKTSYVHPDYKGGVNPNDIALLELVAPLEFNEAVQPIKLPAKNAQPTGTVVLSGWGSVSTSNYPSYPDILQTTSLKALSFNECANRLIGLMGSSEPLDKESNVCTGAMSDNEGACSGDSGGPLIQGDVLVGVVSWGMVPCGHYDAPSVFTKVSNFIDFINEHTGL